MYWFRLRILLLTVFFRLDRYWIFFFFLVYVYWISIEKKKLQSEYWWNRKQYIWWPYFSSMTLFINDSHSSISHSLRDQYFWESSLLFLKAQLLRVWYCLDIWGWDLLYAMRVRLKKSFWFGTSKEHFLKIWGYPKTIMIYYINLLKKRIASA